jgi:hypothetical protein
MKLRPISPLSSPAVARLVNMGRAQRFHFLLLSGVCLSLTGCLRTCCISPEESDRLQFSTEILESIPNQGKHFRVIELKTESPFPEEELFVNGKFAFVVRDDAAAHWVVHDPFRLFITSNKVEKSTWMLIDPRKNDFQQREPLENDPPLIHQFEALSAEQPFVSWGSTNVVDTQQIYDGIENCHAIFIYGKTKFQVFSDTNDNDAAYSYRRALSCGYAPSISQVVAESDDFNDLLSQFRNYQSEVRPSRADSVETAAPPREGNAL